MGFGKPLLAIRPDDLRGLRIEKSSDDRSTTTGLADLTQRPQGSTGDCDYGLFLILRLFNASSRQCLLWRRARSQASAPAMRSWTRSVQSPKRAKSGGGSRARDKGTSRTALLPRSIRVNTRP